MNRRELLLLSLSPLANLAAQTKLPQLRVDSLEFIAVTATRRTSWFFVRVKTNNGLTGLGECSDALGIAFNAQNLASFRATVDSYFQLIKGKPLSIEAYRLAGRKRALEGGLAEATAFSAIEQAQWDLLGKALGAPVYELLGGAIRHELPVYANINRATTTRSPEAFAANAAKAVSEGFRQIKAAPFDGFPNIAKASAADIVKATDLGVACIEAMRKAVGPEVRLMIDVHSNFDVKLAIEVAKRLEPQNLGWYEEPMAPTQLEDTKAVRSAIKQTMAGGESLFGMEGFAGLCRTKAVDIIMPDVKHCGGVLEGRNISAMAALEGVKVAPHNPSGPVATAASTHWCSGLPNFDVLEFQWNEVPWRGALLSPPERFEGGKIKVSTAPGFGVELNDRLAKEHA